jgi:hypothetical protein
MVGVATPATAGIAAAPAGACAGAPFKDQQLLVTLVADEVVTALESEFLMAPSEVDHPRARGDGRRGSSGVVLKKVLEVELWAAVDRDSDGIGKLGAGIVGEDLRADRVVGVAMIIHDGNGFLAVLLLDRGKCANVEESVGISESSQIAAQDVVKRAGAVEGSVGPVILLGRDLIGDILADAEILVAETHGVIEDVGDNLGGIALDVVEAEAIDAGLLDEPHEPGTGVGSSGAAAVAVARVGAAALVAEVVAWAVAYLSKQRSYL